MITKTYKIFSYRNDFTEAEQKLLGEDNNYDSFIEYTAMTLATQFSKSYGEDMIADKLVKLGADDMEMVLIHLDW